MQSCIVSGVCLGLTGEEKEEGDKAKEQLGLDQGEDGEEGGNYKTQNQFHTHLKKQQVLSRTCNHEKPWMKAAKCTAGDGGLVLSNQASRGLF